MSIALKKKLYVLRKLCGWPDLPSSRRNLIKRSTSIKPWSISRVCRMSRKFFTTCWSESDGQKCRTLHVIYKFYMKIVTYSGGPSLWPGFTHLLRSTERGSQSAQSDRRLAMNDWPFVDWVRVRFKNSVMIKWSKGRLMITLESG